MLRKVNAMGSAIARRRLKLLTGLLGVSMTMAGCGGKSVGSSSPPSSQTASPQHSSVAKKTLTPVTLAVAPSSLNMMWANVGIDLGIYRKYGLDVKLVEMTSGQTIDSGLTNGTITFSAWVGSAIRGAEKGLSLKGLLAAEKHQDNGLMVAKDGPSSIQQLAGKTIAFDNVASSQAQLMIYALSQAGLKPGQYHVVYSRQRQNLLMSSKVQAAALDPSQAVPMAKQGYRSIFDTDKLPFPNGGLATSEAEIQQHPAVVRSMVEATLEAVKATKTDSAKVIPIIQKMMGGVSASLASQEFKAFAPVWNVTGVPTKAGLNISAQLDQQALHLTKLPDVSKYYDLSFLPSH